MKKIFYTMFAFLLSAPSMLSANSGSLDSGIAVQKTTTILDLIFLGAKVVGAIAIILGIVELLVEKDQGGQQGKKVSGSMKLAGGILLLLAASVIGWMVGAPDSSNASLVLGNVSAK